MTPGNKENAMRQRATVLQKDALQPALMLLHENREQQFAPAIDDLGDALDVGRAAQ